MALANFFEKSALAASQILKGYDTETFKEKLLNAPIEIAFDCIAMQNSDGLACMDMSIRLLSRLYPTVIITALDSVAEDFIAKYTSIAKEINPAIKITQEEVPSASVVIGATAIQRKGPTFYIGAKEWTVCYSTTKPVLCVNSNFPYAAGAAACFGAANIFRVVFGDQLQNGEIDSDFELSLLNFDIDVESSEIFVADNFNLGDTILVGLGAIGQGVVWALSNTKGVYGTLTVVDGETVDLSNLQRYVLTKQESVDAHKVNIATEALSTCSIKSISHEGDWASFVAKQTEWKFSTVLVAVDSARDRIAIQSSLPHSIINAWTQPMELGVSRHFNFLDDACLACLYPPKHDLPRDSEVIAESLGLSEYELQIREMIYNNAPVTMEWINRITQSKGFAQELLLQFCNLPIRQFYSKVICGGVVLTGVLNQKMETPMAFQSALAGILLASELAIHKVGLRQNSIETTTRFNLLRPLSRFLNDTTLKPKNQDCICQDVDFRQQFSSKYLGD